MSTTPEVFVADKKARLHLRFHRSHPHGFVGFFARHINAQGDFIAWSRMACGAILFGILAYKGRLGDLKTYKISPSMVMSGFFMGNCLSAYIASTQASPRSPTPCSSSTSARSSPPCWPSCSCAKR